MGQLMNNVSWSSNEVKEILKEEERYIIPNNELIEYKEKLLNQCKNLICGVEELYNKSSSKEVYDVIVTLNSAKRSLNSIYTKEVEND